MPVHRTTKNGKPAYQYGSAGAKYVYVSGNEASRKVAQQKAVKQGLAIARRIGKPAHF